MLFGGMLVHQPCVDTERLVHTCPAPLVERFKCAGSHIYILHVRRTVLFRSLVQPALALTCGAVVCVCVCREPPQEGAPAPATGGGRRRHRERAERGGGDRGEGGEVGAAGDSAGEPRPAGSQREGRGPTGVGIPPPESRSSRQQRGQGGGRR